MVKLKSLLICLISFGTLLSQNDLPKDYLSKEFHKERRDALRAQMPPNSIATFFANPVRNRSNDVQYIYHQDPNFYYLTGYKEPHAVLVIFSDVQTNANGETYNELLFVQERNPQAEMWTGKRLGTEGAKQQLGFDIALNGKEFFNSNIDYNSFDKIMFNNFHDDYRDSRRNGADLYDLINSYKSDIGYDNYEEPSQILEIAYRMIKESTVETSANVVQRLKGAYDRFPELKSDPIISQFVDADESILRMELKQQAIKIEAEKPKSKLDSKSLSTIMAGLRQIKIKEEMILLKKAVRISAMGQREVMKAMHPNMSETEVQGIHEYVYKKYGSEYEGYPSIVGAGENGCVLHYIDNNKMTLENDLVLMDLGAEYHGYTADVTRTIPANGKFTKEQKLIYDLVYDAQEAGIDAARKGNSHNSPDAAARKIINAGLAELGIIPSANSRHSYFPHGTSHYLGLDVHDPGLRGPYESGMVITVEPGIYIPEGSDCDKKWWGIAVRIEDDILITDSDPINLSFEAPRKSSEIEKLMAESSALDDFKLPKLDKD
ncbi:MAG: aminopeptidase P N-terminal domain-containing protein [Bacteroidia bacterium]|nr:aminopeptidase P N-terminal domain-containing protein [Bacteroidia bacterium]